MAGETCKCGARLRDDGSCPWGCPQDRPRPIDPEAFAGWEPYESPVAGDDDQVDDEQRGGGRWWA